MLAVARAGAGGGAPRASGGRRRCGGTRCPEGGYLAKHALVAAYRQLVESGEWAEDPALLERIRMKPVRTLSGVTTVTVLTKPYPCPGEVHLLPHRCAHAQELPAG